MGTRTEVQHRLNARRYVDETNRKNAKLKEGRNATLSSVKEHLVQKTIHKIEREIAAQGLSVPRSVFSGFPRPWKDR